MRGWIGNPSYALRRLMTVIMTRIPWCVVPILLSVSFVTVVHAQLTENEPTKGIRLDKAHRTRYVVGVLVRADGGPCRGLAGTIPIVSSWPEQQVSIVNEEFTSHIESVRYEKRGRTVEEMHVSIPVLPTGELAKALVTFDITRHTTLPPENPENLIFPKRIRREVRQYLGPSRMIEVRDSGIRRLAKDLAAEDENAWNLMEAIYRAVQERVDLKRGEVKGAAAALRDGSGNPEDMTSLFIALCRVNGVPARTVWVPDGCYAEYYLHDDNAKGHWIPCDLTGDCEFGTINSTRPILQKGDRFKVPGKRRPVRFIPESMTVKAGIGRPNVTFVRRLESSDS